MNDDMMVSGMKIDINPLEGCDTGFPVKPLIINFWNNKYTSSDDETRLSKVWVSLSSVTVFDSLHVYVLFSNCHWLLLTYSSIPSMCINVHISSPVLSLVVLYER